MARVLLEKLSFSHVYLTVIPFQDNDQIVGGELIKIKPT